MSARPALRAGLLAATLFVLGACSQEKAENLTPRDLTPETLGTYMLGLSTQTADEMKAALK